MSSSRYWELTVEIPEEASEGLTNFVWELGALGVVEEELPGRRPRVRAFFPKTLVARALEESVREYLGGLRELGFPGAGEPSVVALASQDWADAWRANFRPLSVGKRLLIAPPWERPRRPAAGTAPPPRPPARGRLPHAHASPTRPAPPVATALGTAASAIAPASPGLRRARAHAVLRAAVAIAEANAARNRVCDRVR